MFCPCFGIQRIDTELNMILRFRYFLDTAGALQTFRDVKKSPIFSAQNTPPHFFIVDLHI